MNFWTVSRRLPCRIILIENVESNLFDYEEKLISSRYVFYDLEREEWIPFDRSVLDKEFDDPESAMRYLENRLGIETEFDIELCLERLARYTVEEVRSSIDNLINEDIGAKLRMVEELTGECEEFDTYILLFDDIQEKLSGIRNPLYSLMKDRRTI